LSCAVTVSYRVRLLRIGFCGGSKGGSLIDFREGVIYAGSVFCLFLICCFSGVLLSWVILGGVGVCLRGVDLVLGGFLLFVGLFIYFVGKISYGVFVFLAGIGFVKWIRTGGFSSCFSWMKLHEGDCSWIFIICWFIYLFCWEDFLWRICVSGWYRIC